MNTPHHEPRRAPPRGFTLIELLVVIAILGILGTVVLKNVWGHIDEAKQIAAKEKVDQVDSALQMYKRRHNELPNDLRLLLEADPLNNGEPWVTEETLVDPWGWPLDLKIDERNQFEVISYGENKAADGFTLEYGLSRDIGSKHPLNPPKEGGR